ncbi:hypothetical protein CMO89_00135 [Candidatus Woesearchaeota archaeon]|nr:hypothetical protein [Candidatus Woesearchaeota archaeon]|tara:strand:+ start:15429 stop:15764 length:336 start_codon:yes stop_codon:yes gene_type:complete
MITKNMLKLIGVIVLITFAAMILSTLLIKPVPPVLKFVDEKTDTALSGFVYLDDKYIGEVYEDGFFNDLPEEYCKGEHTITIKSSEYELSWGSMPSDCKAGLITLNYKDGE